MRKRVSSFLYAFVLAVSAAVSGAARDIPPVISGQEDLSIHFLELGNKYTGDCVYINYGDIDILIDAGSRQSSAAPIRAYINNYTKDYKLEYVIVTHAHADHIAGFTSSRNITGIFDFYEIGTIIDFPKTNSATKVYNKYKDTRDAAVENGTVHYTALQCFNNEDGARRIFDLGGGVKLEILYNYYYENYTSNENNYSVCARIIQNENQYLFTGDLEEDAEEKLVDYYESNFGGIGGCVLYKGGHHGSNSSAGEKLLAAITPEYVCLCTCAGTSEYRASPENTFPSQGFIDRIAPYTDKIYVTTLIKNFRNNEFVPLNGAVVFWVSGGNVSVVCAASDRKLKDSEWFLNNREMPEAWIQNGIRVVQ